MATLADDPIVLARFLVFPQLPVTPASSVHAPCCKRRTSADAVRDVRHIKTLAVRGKGQGRLTREDPDWMCDACITRMFRSPHSGWTLPRMARATGESEPAVKVLRAREITQDNVRLDPDLDPLAEYDRVIATLPDRDIPGTEIPPDGRKD